MGWTLGAIGFVASVTYLTAERILNRRGGRMPRDIDRGFSVCILIIAVAMVICFALGD